MIYLVTLNQELFENNTYKIISPEESLRILSSWGNMAQADSETMGRDAHICDILCFQIGKCDGSDQIVIDTTTVDIKLYKDYLEKTYLIFQNAKFDLQFLYNYGIIPRKIYDTMIVEQLLHLGYPSGIVSYSLASIAERRLGIYLDKSVRGEIIWRGLDARVIEYAAKDVIHLYKIMESQLKECKEKSCLVGAKLECDCVPAVAYLEWCGIKLDIYRWKEKMKRDEENLDIRLKALNTFVESDPDKYKDFVEIDLQGDLFTGFDTSPKCNINWDSSKQVIKFCKTLGFDTSVQDKKTGEDKDSVLEKSLKVQKGVNDEFLSLYFNYKESSKLCSTYGQGHIDAVNPKTGRIHSVYHQLGASSGRFSCGSNQPNVDLAKYKGISPSRVKYPNCQQLPSDYETRSCFVAEEGNLLADCDYNSEEARLAGDIYQDKAIIEMFEKGLDSHSVYAKVFFKDQLADVPVEEIKAKYPKLRQLAKGPEFE